jgi:four helix bundle protein
MNPEAMKIKTKAFALKIITLVSELPETRIFRVIGNQVLRSGTSVGANYRAACRARSKPDFISKMGIVLEESDETAYWLELLSEARLIKHERVSGLIQEAYEFVAIAVSSIKTARLQLREKRQG